MTLSLQQYLIIFHNGCKADMARSFGRKPQHVTKMFKSPEKWLVVVEDDQHRICQIRAKRTPSLATGGDTGCLGQ